MARKTKIIKPTVELSALADDRLLTLKDAMGYLSVSRSWLYRKCAEGQLTMHHVGNSVRFYAGDIRRLID